MPINLGTIYKSGYTYLNPIVPQPHIVCIENINIRVLHANVVVYT